MKQRFDTCFFERYAMCSLHTLLGERYANLVNMDRPDLQDVNRGIGIEVTRAMREDKQAAQALVNEMADCKIFDTNPLCDEVRSYGYSYGLGDNNNLGEHEYQYWLLAMPLKRILESKVRKVTNGFYGSFSEFGLYVFTRFNLDTREVEDSLRYIASLQQGSSQRYDTLYISEIHRMYVCDLTIGTFRTIDISHEQCRYFYNKAVQVEPLKKCLLTTQKNVSL